MKMPYGFLCLCSIVSLLEACSGRPNSHQLAQGDDSEVQDDNNDAPRIPEEAKKYSGKGFYDGQVQFTAPGTPLQPGTPIFREMDTQDPTLSHPGPRHYVIYVGATVQPGTPAPLVFNFHGFTMSGRGMMAITGWKELADQQGIIVVFPDGQTNGPKGENSFRGPGPWNVGKDVKGIGHDVETNGQGDDIGFMTKMRQDVESQHPIDPNRVYVTGFSMGGYFTNHVACTLSRKFAAGFSPHSGSTYDWTSCDSEPAPALLLHGNADWLIGVQHGKFARDQWIKRNGCSSEFDSLPVKKGTCEIYKGCPAKGQVAMCTFDGLGHAWAGGNPYPEGPFSSMYGMLASMDNGMGNAFLKFLEVLLFSQGITQGMLKFTEITGLAQAPAMMSTWDYLYEAPDFESAAALQWNFFQKYSQ